jgi:hypothetical protein
MTKFLFQPDPVDGGSQCDRANPKGDIGAAFSFTQLLGGYDGGQADYVRARV